jgi:predicted metal-dependent hydrolase
MAHLEAASVHAFLRLREELTSIQAPRALVRRAERAARDEVRHARVTARLARRRGAEPAPVVIERVEREGAPRSLADLALENAVEGCVRESFGALVAMRQASQARDPQVARAMARIARDETEHAALAWAIARWVAPRLDGVARSKVRRAVRSALASLRCATARIPADVAGELGLPTGAEGRGLVDAFAGACFTRRA